ncbi:MAG TPA: APC family permease [Candidatus Bathyarchaeia archaeon]|nr:APC family permease [Candidatus Bathyarchaeia archaeon]
MTSSTKPTLFVREATGLVRSMSAWDMLFLNVVSFGGAWSIIYALEYAPLYGGNVISSLILTAPGILALLGVYYIFQVSMPRSGGDYVFVSRVLHPAIGLAANFAGYAFFLWFWIGDAADVFSSQGLAQTLSVYGSLTGQQWAINAASAFTPMTTFLVGTVAIIFFTLVVLFSTKLYFYIQNVSMVIAILAILVMIALIAGTNPTSFAAVFNSYVSSQGVTLGQGAYNNFTATGNSYWGGQMPMDPISTFNLIPLWFTVLFWVFVSSYLGGELKNTRTSAKTALFGSFGIIFVATLLILGLAYNNLGPQFLTGAGYYGFGYATNPLPVIPNLTLFVSILSNNPVLVWFIGIGVIAGFLLVAPQCMILMSRIIFAYSFDRLAPSFFANINERSHTPVNSILTASIGGEIFLIFLSGIVGPSTSNYAFLLYSYAGLAAVGIAFVFVSISAILFPYRRRELYETACPIKRKIAGVPVVVLLGVVALAYCLLTIVYYSYDYLFYFGAGTLAADLYFFPFLTGVAGLFIACLVWFYLAKVVRSKEGMPFEKAFQEIPPE